jgi:hypothetical protein
MVLYFFTFFDIMLYETSKNNDEGAFHHPGKPPGKMTTTPGFLNLKPIVEKYVNLNWMDLDIEIGNGLIR